MLPKKLIVIKNKDKDFHEIWKKTRDLLDIPHPFRMIVSGRPNVGKTMAIKNIILRIAKSHKPFRKIMVVHCDSEGTKEYTDLDCEMLEGIPRPDEFDGTEKTLVVLEDLDLKSMGIEQKGCLDRLFGYSSTHLHISVILTSQDLFSIPVGVRRCSNFLIFWKSHDFDSMANVARKSGLESHDLKEIFNNICNQEHDSL